MTTYTTRPIAWIVGPPDEPIFDERMTLIEIEVWEVAVQTYRNFWRGQGHLRVLSGALEGGK